MAQQVFVSFVGLFGISHSGILSHGPQPAAVHSRLDPSREGIFPRIPKFLFVLPPGWAGRGVQLTNWNMGRGRRIAWRSIRFGAMCHLRVLTAAACFRSPKRSNAEPGE